MRQKTLCAFFASLTRALTPSSVFRQACPHLISESRSSPSFRWIPQALGGSTELVCLRRKLKVLHRDAAFIMSHQSQTHFVVVDIDVGVMSSLLRQLTHLIHKSQRGSEVLEEEGTYEFTRFDLPVRNCHEFRFDLLLGESSHYWFSWDR